MPAFTLVEFNLRHNHGVPFPVAPCISQRMVSVRSEPLPLDPPDFWAWITTKYLSTNVLVLLGIKSLHRFGVIVSVQPSVAEVRTLFSACSEQSYFWPRVLTKL
jgi:hypothetical protein